MVISENSHHFKNMYVCLTNIQAKIYQNVIAVFLHVRDMVLICVNEKVLTESENLHVKTLSEKMKK